MNLILRRSTAWTILNLLGMAVFLRLASELWVLPGEDNLPGGPGDAFYWFFVLVPVLLGYLTLNLIALVVIVKRARETRAKMRIYVWGSVAILWLMVFRYDNIRSFRDIAPPTGTFSMMHSKPYA